MAKADLTAQRLRELLNYSPETGKFTWAKTASPSAPAGSNAGSICRKYVRIRISGRDHKAHRLAWLHEFGEWPKHEIDHIDGDTQNNKIGNLRDVPKRMNAQNRRVAMKTNKSCGFLGVTASQGRWQASITTDRSKKFLGNFDTPEEAHASYIEAKRRLHPGCTI